MVVTFVKYKTGQGEFTITTDYKLETEVGNGGYGVVCSARVKETGDEVAIKKVKLPPPCHPGGGLAYTRLLREVRLLRFFDHENIVKLHSIMRIPDFDFNEYYFVTDLMQSDLDSVIRSSQGLTMDHVRHFMYLLLRGMKYVHSAGVVHRDLKPKNILVNQECDVKICDFGLAREMSGEALSVYVETRWYRAPELIMQSPRYDNKVDVWSMGCVLAELLLRRPLWRGAHAKHQMDLILETLGTPSEEDLNHLGTAQAREYVQSYVPNASSDTRRFETRFANFDPEAVGLLREMLQFNPQKRPDVETLLNHPFFASERYTFENGEIDEPVSETKFAFELDLDADPRLDVHSLRHCLYEEMRSFHPDMPEAENRMVACRSGQCRNARKKSASHIELEPCSPVTMEE